MKSLLFAAPAFHKLPVRGEIRRFVDAK